MGDNSILWLASVGALLLGGLLGWLLWGRGLAAIRSTLAETEAALEAERGLLGAEREAHAGKREVLARSVTEVAHYKARYEQAEPHVERAAALAAELAALRAGQEARDAAHAAAMAERDRVHEAQLRQLKEEFQRLAGEALEKAQASFATQAAATLDHHRAEAAKGLAESRTALSDLVGPMKTSLDRYETELKAIEAKREQAYGSLAEQLAGVAVGQQAVRHEAGKIVAALRSSSKASGAWGEAQLRNVLEMAGLREGIDFELQASATDDEGQRRRPDAVLKLPGGRELVVDSKCALADYLAASEAEGEAERAAALRRHALCVRAHAKGLAEKAYWKQFAASADFVVMFLPGENFLSAALEQDLDLLGWALDQRILLAGPTNLLAIARVVAMVWRQEKMADEARAIGELGAQLYAALATMTEHVGRIGKNIGDTANAYNDFVGSLESNVLPKARRFPELGVDRGKKELGAPARVERPLRLVPPELRRLEGGS